MTNATLIINQDSGTHQIPVTWVKDGFMEGEKLYEEIFMTDTLVDCACMEMTVELDSDPTIKSYVNWSDEAGVVYPIRLLKNMEQKV